jgi:hypothetical protein
LVLLDSVVAVLDVTSVELLLGHRVETVGWVMVSGLGLVVLGRLLLNLLNRPAPVRGGGDFTLPPENAFGSAGPDPEPALVGQSPRLVQI